MENGGKARYYVLFTQTLKQWDVTEVIKRTLPEGRGTVFYPCTELWIGSLGRTVVKPLFPGYVFIRSDMDQYEMHDFIIKRRSDVLSFMRELCIGKSRSAGEDPTDVGGESLIDLDDDEAELLDFMLGFRLEDKDKRILHGKLPESGVMGMSYGYKDKNGRYIVMEGPLKGHEDRIVEVNPRDCRAYLNLKVGGRPARVGLTVKGRKYWFPKDKEAPDILGDGTMVDCRSIAAAMMGKAKGSL